MLTISKDMEVGVAKIDTQHKELVDRINALTKMGTQSVNSDETKKTLDMLGSYVVKHFSDEEALQKQVNYPEYEAHKQLHKNFIGELDKLKKEFDQNGYSAKFTLEISNTVIKWIVSHIKGSDVKFGKFYNAAS